MSLQVNRSPFLCYAGFGTALFLFAGCHSTPINSTSVDAASPKIDSVAKPDVHLTKDAAKIVDSIGESQLQDVNQADANLIDANLIDVCIVCNGVCFDPLTNPNNCGSCGNNCQGGGCNQGACGPAPIVLASGQSANDPVAIATDGINVYWADQGSCNGEPDGGISCTGTVNQIAANAPSGTLPTILASNQYSPLGIATDGINVYWTNIFSVNQIAVGGGMITTLASNQNDS